MLVWSSIHYQSQKLDYVGILPLNFVMGGSACGSPYFSLGKSKQNRVLRKTRVQGGTFKNEVFPRYQHLNLSHSAQTVAQDGVEAKEQKH